MVNSDGKFDLHIDDLKMIFTDQRSQDVLRKHNVTTIELRKTDKAVFFGEVNYLFGQIDMCRWIDTTKKYSSFTIIQEKPDGITPQLDEDISSLNIPQLMARARGLNNDPKTLDSALQYYAEALKRDPHNDQTVAIMMSFARVRYGNDLENRLKIYDTILEYYPAAGSRTIASMMSAAHKDYSDNLESWLKIYGTILKHKPDNENAIAVMMTLSHQKYRNDLVSRLKIYDVILECIPNYGRAINAMMNMASYDYPYNSPEFVAIMNTLERYHPTSEDNFNHSGPRENLLILNILYLKRDYKEIVRLTENVTAPDLLQLRSEALHKLT